MASARKKQDEKNLKFLRELVSLPGNKHCFDCNQRGPTYVNMTIGSFVCTKCSGMLRGLTPPHRVKSISMASFTSEEVEMLKGRGNQHCRSTWLALYDPSSDMEKSTSRDDQHLKDFMVDKYERRRYYHDAPSRMEQRNAINGGINGTTNAGVKPSQSILSINGNSHSHSTGTPSNTSSSSGDDFVADFSSADIFSAASHFNNNTSTPINNTPPQQQACFANFDNNVIFNSATTYPSSYDLLVNQLQFNQMSMPRYAHWNMTAATNGHTTNGLNSGPPPPSEDRYAALKDLDNALKTQQQQQEQQVDWGSNGSGYTSPVPPQQPQYGSPSQGAFITSFQDTPISNPFSQAFPAPRSPWSTMNGNGASSSPVLSTPFSSPGFSNGPVPAQAPAQSLFSSSPGANPFRDNFTPKYNGVNGGFGGFNGVSSQFSKPWGNPNPFTQQLGISPGGGGSSNNPFL